MSLNGINSNTVTQSAYQTKLDSIKSTSDTSDTATDTAVVYEKSSASTTTVSSATTTDNSSIIAQLKADAEARTSQLQNLVEKLLSKQSQSFSLAYGNNLGSLWKEISQGADAQTIAQAKADVSEDGYWGVTQTAERILDFAKALSGGDASKIDELTEAIEKGFKLAEKQWGGELPDICQQTYDAVMKGIEEWKAEASGTEA